LLLSSRPLWGRATLAFVKAALFRLRGRSGRAMSGFVITASLAQRDAIVCHCGFRGRATFLFVDMAFGAVRRF